MVIIIIAHWLLDHYGHSHSFGHRCRPHAITQGFTFANILCNALDPDYTSDQAVDDLGKLTNEATQMQLQEKTDSPRFVELESIIPIQEKLVKAKLDGHPIFDRLGTLNAEVHEDD